MRILPSPRQPHIALVAMFAAIASLLVGPPVPVSAVGLIGPVRVSLHAGSGLAPGESIYSPSGTFQLSLQVDGNLVLYLKTKRGLVPTWSSQTNGQGANIAAFQPDGNFVVYRDRTPLWASGTHNKGATELVLQDDGNLVIYDASRSAKWASGSVHASCQIPIEPNLEFRDHKKARDIEYIQKRPGWGCFRINLFIPTKNVTWAGQSIGKGDNRGFEDGTGVERSRGSIWIDFETGVVETVANYSVALILRQSRTYNAYPTSTGSFGPGNEGSLNVCGNFSSGPPCVQLKNQVVVAPPPPGEVLRLRYHFTTAGNQFPGPTDASSSDGIVCIDEAGAVRADRDGYPSIEIYKEPTSPNPWNAVQTTSVLQKEAVGGVGALGGEMEQSVNGGCGAYQLWGEHAVWPAWMLPWKGA